MAITEHGNQLISRSSLLPILLTNVCEIVFVRRHRPVPEELKFKLKVGECYVQTPTLCLDPFMDYDT